MAADTVDRARSAARAHRRWRPYCENNRTKRSTSSSSLGAQAELRIRSQLVRRVLSSMGPRGVRAGHRGSPPRTRRRSAVLDLSYPRMRRHGRRWRGSRRRWPLTGPERSCAWILVSAGTAERFDEAIPRSRRAGSATLCSLAVVFGQWRKLSEADALHRELLERAPRVYVPSAYLVLTAEAAGQHEEALAFARRAWDEREPPFIPMRHFPSSHGAPDPRFAARFSAK